MTQLRENDTAIREAPSAKERICSMLLLSQQSTFEEVQHEYHAQMTMLGGLAPSDAAEKALLERKKQSLEEAFQAFCEEYSSDQQPDMPKIPSQPARSRHGTTLYGFHIPCFFWAAARCTDWLIGSCCSGCGCCPEDDVHFCYGCYDSEGLCPYLQCLDTVIAISIIGSCLVTLLGEVGPFANLGFRRFRQRRSEKKAERREEKFLRNYRQHYQPQLKEAYAEWSELKKYDKDIRGFLQILDACAASDKVNADFHRVMNAVNAEYQQLDERWTALKKRLSDLEKDNLYYNYMCKNDLIYKTMFNEINAPWER